MSFAGPLFSEIAARVLPLSPSLAHLTVSPTSSAFGFAGFVLMAALVLWWFLRRCRQNRRAGGPQGSNTSSVSSTHNSFTSLASLFRRPFSRRSNPPPPADASATASKRGWLHNSSRDWDQIDDDEADLVSPSGGGRGRPGESMELYNAVSRSNPDPVGSRERRESRSPRPDQQSFGRGTHPYGQGGHEASVNSLNFASTSTVRLSAPEQGGGGEDGGGGTPRGYRDESPFEGAGSESGYFTPVGEGGGQERPVLERPVSGRFRENDDERSVGGR